MSVPTEAPPSTPTFLELEITSRCQLTCTHCYAESGPTGDHGTMNGDEWRRVLSEAAELGVHTVQFIGGEPTLHPEFAELLGYALGVGLRVEVYSNLYRLGAKEWALLERPGVGLATSYYSDDPAEHDAITSRTGSHARTRANIAEAVRRGIALRVGIIHMHEGQRSEQARAELEALGVERVSVDRVRGVGNAAGALLPSTSALCGRCADGIAAILPDGTVAPCVMGRFLPAGHVQGTSLARVFTSPRWHQVAASIPRAKRGCVPQSCTPGEDSCQPSPGAVASPAHAGQCPPTCDPANCEPSDTDSCGPRGNEPCPPMSEVARLPERAGRERT
ncbi:radical SAM protein [Streptomyces sp. ODS28]|uniref:radical SAM protein n=1 Tax=Streptomyces sp. ODS28 TaxID=3136688 RepID=UPI0031EC861A